MRIALMSANLGENFDVQIEQVKGYLEDYLSVDLLCFGNQYLLGNNQLTGDYDKDVELGLTLDSKEILMLRGLAKKFRVSLGFGFVEKDENDILYNSYMILDENGQIVTVHRSCCNKWKPNPEDSRYGSGENYELFTVKDTNFVIASYGDLEYMDYIMEINSLSPDAVIWPITLAFNPTEWRNEGLNDLANQLKIIKPHVFLVNSYADDDYASGGAYVFHDGNVIKELPLGNQGILIVSSDELE